MVVRRNHYKMLVTEEREFHHYNKSILINFKDLSTTSLQFAFPENCTLFPNIHKRRPSPSTSQVYNGFDDRETKKANGRAEACTRDGCNFQRKTQCTLQFTPARLPLSSQSQNFSRPLTPTIKFLLTRTFSSNHQFNLLARLLTMLSLQTQNT